MKRRRPPMLLLATSLGLGLWPAPAPAQRVQSQEEITRGLLNRPPRELPGNLDQGGVMGLRRSTLQEVPSMNPAAPASTAPPSSGQHRQAPQRDVVLRPGSQHSLQVEEQPSISLYVQFPTGSADLTPAAQAVLQRLGGAMRDERLASDRFRVEGHTDTVGDQANNQQLSERRAQAAVDFLSRHLGIDPARLQAVGLGERALLIPTPDETSETRNRRVQIVNITR